MIGSYLSEFTLGATVSELQQSQAEKLIQNSKSIQAEYRRSAGLNKCIYDLAWEILVQTLGKDGISLPVDVRQVAEALGFTVSSDDFASVELNYLLNDHDCLPIAQLKMRRKLFGKGSEQICGTICVAEYLSENSKRFSIAHELGHFVLRHQNPIGSSVILDACPGLYPLVNTEEMLADMFAYALLLPYGLFKQERGNYEKDRTHWPLDFSMWVSYIRDKAQIPEYHAVIACQEIKKLDIFLCMEEAEAAFKKWALTVASSDSEDVYSVIKSLYARTVFNLEGWGFSNDQVADILFQNCTWFAEAEDSRLRKEIVPILHDYHLREKIEKSAASQSKLGKPPMLPQSVIDCVVGALNSAGLSPDGINKVTELPLAPEAHEPPPQESAAETGAAEETAEEAAEQQTEGGAAPEP
nr:ImmA/IrrE family metallo-endopeptidase [uncultured Oscillibacter sp.]